MSGGFDFFDNGSDVPDQVSEYNDSTESSGVMREGGEALEKDHFFNEIEETVKRVEGSEESSEEEPLEAAEEAQEEVEVTEVAEESVTEEQVAEIKKLMAKFGEESYELPAEAKFSHKVDGEDVEVNLQELLNNYSGKTSWDKKFGELSSERNAYKDDMDYVNKYVGEFAAKSKENPVQALEFLAKEIGLDPLEYRKSLRSQLLNTYGEYLSMDDNQRQGFEQKEELEYLRRQRETESQVRAQQQANMELEGKYQEMQQSHGIDGDRRATLERELREDYNVSVTPENLLELHTTHSRLDRVEATLDKVSPELAADSQKVLMLESFLRSNPQMSDEQLYDSASKLWGNDVSKAVANLAKKLPKKENVIPKQEYKPKMNSVNNVDFFND